MRESMVESLWSGTQQGPLPHGRAIASLSNVSGLGCWVGVWRVAAGRFSDRSLSPSSVMVSRPLHTQQKVHEDHGCETIYINQASKSKFCTLLA
jgi:hypothetical protein